MVARPPDRPREKPAALSPEAVGFRVRTVRFERRRSRRHGACDARRRIIIAPKTRLTRCGVFLGRRCAAARNARPIPRRARSAAKRSAGRPIPSKPAALHAIRSLARRHSSCGNGSPSSDGRGSASGSSLSTSTFMNATGRRPCVRVTTGIPPKNRYASIEPSAKPHAASDARSADTAERSQSRHSPGCMHANAAKRLLAFASSSISQPPRAMRCASQQNSRSSTSPYGGRGRPTWRCMGMVMPNSTRYPASCENRACGRSASLAKRTRKQPPSSSAASKL